LLDERSRIAGISRKTLKEYFLKPLMFNRFESGDINKSFNLSTFSTVLGIKLLTFFSDALSLQGLLLIVLT
jgi:hypothetical protein